ncbi:hypothetical protein, partial [Candidatus Methylomirabilis sp.]|uniref:hypothetical protein n=1 Tax=Candidatus Methylomirabilis sp. TaxID=2032687 RepID=UPI003C738526
MSNIEQGISNAEGKRDTSREVSSALSPSRFNIRYWIFIIQQGLRFCLEGSKYERDKSCNEHIAHVFGVFVFAAGGGGRPDPGHRTKDPRRKTQDPSWGRK